MSPDEMHAEYYKNNPKGNHDTMSPETRVSIQYMQDDIRETKELTKLIPEIHHIIQDILTQVNKTNGRVTTIEAWQNDVKQPLYALIKNETERTTFLKNTVLKIIAVGSLMGLLGQNADKIIDLL